MKRKYKFTGETKVIQNVPTEYFMPRRIVLQRIVAVRSFGSVTKGDIGGWIESDENLSHDGNCWVEDNATVFSEGRVEGNAHVKGCAKVYLGAVICDDATVSGYAKIYKHARVGGKTQILDNVTVRKGAEVKGKAVIKDEVLVSDGAIVSGHVRLDRSLCIRGRSNIEKPTDYLAIGPLPPYSLYNPGEKSGKQVEKGLYLVFSKVNNKTCVNGDSPSDAKDLLRRLYQDSKYLQKAMMEVVDMGIEQFEDSAN